jgi:hypothetical protein
MTRFADTHTRLTDDARLRADRDADARAFAAPFEKIQAKARANRDALLAPRRGFAFAIA